MITLALGLQSSASTWMYNVIRELYAVQGVSAFEAQTLEGVWLAKPKAAPHMLMKAHAIDGGLLALLNAAECCAVVTMRDPRDAIASIYQRLLPDPVDAARNVVRSYASCMTAIRCLRSRFYTYESGFFDAVETLLELSEFLRLPLRHADALAIAQKYSVAHVQSLVQSLGSLESVGTDPVSGTLYDKKTLFNQSHIGDRRVGKWEEVLPVGLHRQLVSLFGEGKEGRILRGMAMEFSEGEIFSWGEPYVPSVEGSGQLLLNGVHLPAGRWAVTITGGLPDAISGRMMVCHSGNVIATVDLPPSGRAVLEFEYLNRSHDDQFTVHVGAESMLTVDPTREDRFVMRCVYLCD
jgi:hypothetical protein